MWNMQEIVRHPPCVAADMLFLLITVTCPLRESCRRFVHHLLCIAVYMFLLVSGLSITRELTKIVDHSLCTAVDMLFLLITVSIHHVKAAGDCSSLTVFAVDMLFLLVTVTCPLHESWRRLFIGVCQHALSLIMLNYHVIFPYLVQHDIF